MSTHTKIPLKYTRLGLNTYCRSNTNSRWFLLTNMHVFILFDWNGHNCSSFWRLRTEFLFFPENQTNTGSKNNHWGQNATQIETIQRKLSKQGAEVILLGDSIIKNMERFASKYFTFFPASTVFNAGIPGDIACAKKPENLLKPGNH